MAKVLSFKCPHCLAPLSAGKDEVDLACRYCGARLHIEHKKPPPADVRARELAQAKEMGTAATVYVASATVNVLVAGAAALFALVGVVVAFLVLAPPKNTKKGPALTTSFPATCYVNGRMEIRGVTADVAGTAITASSNCRITIVDSRIKAATLLEMKGANIEVTIEGGRLESSGDLVVLGAGSKVKATKQATLIAGGVAIGNADVANAEIGIESSTIEATRALVAVGSNLKLDVADSKLTSREDGIRAENGAKLKLRNATLSAGRVGVGTKSGLHLELERSSIEGAEGGVDAAHSIDSIELRAGSAVNGKAFAIRSGQALSSLRVTGSQVVSEGTAIGSGNTATVTIEQGAHVRGGEAAIRSTGDLRVQMRSSTIEARKVALASGEGGAIDANAGVIRGATAYDFKRKPAPLVVDAVAVEGARLVGGRPQKGR